MEWNGIVESTTHEPWIDEYSIIVSSIGILIDPSLLHIEPLFMDIRVVVIILLILLLIVVLVVLTLIQILPPLWLFELIGVPNVIGIGGS
jgi:hypothetical protein